MSSSNSFTISGNLIDVHQRRIYAATVEVKDGRISSITETSDPHSHYLLPGFIDAHVHIESSMLVPTEFAKLAVVHGTVATVSDPHEIANVCGLAGVEYMIENGEQTPFKFFFGAPSCVPATSFETAGAVIDAKDIDVLLQNDSIWYLSEMMNYPGVLYEDSEVIAKLEAAKRHHKPIDGHAPGVRGEDIQQYAAAGITTDHESFTYDEAIDKINAGMHCLIREGSAAKNFEALIDVLRVHPEKVMFCSDDKHPDELVLDHINGHVKRALAKGYNLFDVLRAACVNPVLHYQLPVGLLRKGDPADFIVIDNIEDFNILDIYIGGDLVAKNGISLLASSPITVINNFSASPIRPEELLIKANAPSSTLHVIEALEGQLITKTVLADAHIENGCIVSDVQNDILKIVVINRYQKDASPAIAFIKNFGLRHGALASTVAHDCHNIIAVGADDESMCAAINALIETKGGIAVAQNGGHVLHMPLPIAGLMSDKDGHHVAKEYATLDKAAKELGSPLKAPFMTLSFMALLVIPELKLSDKGLFDGKQFAFTPLIKD